MPIELFDVFTILYSAPIASLTIFLLAALYSKTTMSDVGKKAWRWIIAGASFYLLNFAFGTNNLIYLGIANTAAIYSNLILNAIAFVLILIGSIKLIIELIQSR